ncbi:hypothetical protein BN59_01313 [Legionella massiliensis]|uniref:Uncharacterized protein n=1 Tax=Legionella massiliensis TaxID=1034943 RepID=A0A078KZ50_9GAMM|nr:hypothetical protein [Legionella massiliensis]CDZ77034.1 hypothetical protein BN59_01313 [Legionella massiliensis]CEE12772.1 hypothetical protein BN1094_01313 [Legionella massiliensis]
MVLECDKITSELEKYENLISDLITIIGPDSHSMFSGIISQINSLKERCLDKAIKEKELLDELNIKFNEIEDSACYLFEFIMRNSTTKKQYEWLENPSKDKQKIDVIRENMENFKIAVIETNESYLVKLRQQKALLESQGNKKLSDKLNKISSCIQKIEENLSVLSFEDLEINRLLQPVRNTKKKIAADIRDGSGLNFHNEKQENEFYLRKNVEDLYEQFNALADLNASLNLAVSDIDKLGQNSSTISNAISLFREAEQSSKQLIEKTFNSWTQLYNIIKPENHQALINELNAAIKKLSNLNKEKSALQDLILSKQKRIIPTESSVAELKHCLEQDKHNLRDKLELFLSVFSILDLRDREDSDNSYFIEKLQNFIEIISQDLQADGIPINHKPVAKFSQEMQQHIGEKLKWHLLGKDDKKSISMDAIAHFLNELFKPSQDDLSEPSIGQRLFNIFDSSSIEKAQVETLKKQIIALRTLTDKIQQFPISEIKDHHTLKTVQIEQDKETARKVEQLQISINNSIENLRSKLALMSNKFTSYEEVEHGRKILNSLEQFKSRLAISFDEYNQKIERLLTIESPFERLGEVTNLQESFLRDLASFEKEFKAADGLNSLAVKAQLSLLSLYNTEKSKLIHDLRSSINNARAALGVYHQDEEIKEKLAAEHKVLEDIIASDQSQSLFKIEFDISFKITALQGQVQMVRAKIKDDCRPTVGEINNQLRAFNASALSAHNPFITVLGEKQNLASQEATRLNDEFNALDQRPATELLTSVRKLEDAVTQAEKHLQQRNSMLTKALIIQRRMESKEYKMSLRLIVKLQEEFVRLLDETHIKAAIKNHPDDQQALEELRQNPQALFQGNNLSKEQVDLLDKVDLRLNKLKAIANDFKLMNNNYINRNLDLLGDERYGNLLLSKVEAHIHNSQMEHFSDGKRSDFVQWLRTNILKPVQSLTHYVGFKIGVESYTKNRFFTTAGATKTEDLLVVTGNELYTNLAAAAA